MALYSHFSVNRHWLKAKESFIYTNVSKNTGKGIKKHILSQFSHIFVWKTTVVGVFILFAIISAPLKTEASIISSITSFFNNLNVRDQSMRASVINSQTMPVLESSPTPSQAGQVGGGDISILGNALTAEIGPEGTIANIEGNMHGTTITTYVVREGDTVGAIAKMFGVSINTIAWANNLKYTNIRVGQGLIILPIDGIKHTIKDGDTLSKIAKQYKAEEEEILSFNNLSSGSKLAVGMDIIIPSAEYSGPSIGDKPKVRGTGGPNYDGYYIFPVPNGRKTQGLHGFNSIDIGNYLGAPIVASASGEVIIVRNSGWNGGYGKYIVIAHSNGTQTLYAHTNENLVFEGMKVYQGQIIAYMGSTGNSTGPHVHFEVRGAKQPF